MLFHKLIATSLGIGYIGKGAGTVAAVFCALCWYLAWAGGYPALIPSVAITLVITAIGVWSSKMVIPLWGKDPSRVVVDEVAGMAISLLFAPVKLPYVLIALVLFRFFDIAKPLFIRKMESLEGGWGIMADDILAGIYANICLQIILLFKFF
ncbi:phosphatidylglycerophosphatase A [Mucilaginibacter sp. RS28]|uniref:Phosphatidylglycerophosphatase A n=1 Tax=Mucilaginibacter straminoryzae TaxID=2932774 RepID=A0A9X1X7D4_9SPHI|nr:phosphatidylglycerophosphatase A [Mucilaginibacter straminoryzae]MCJ8211510.1 phosphatidylglycerophosphatase A [Mucilaginibacter straminoryzae]